MFEIKVEIKLTGHIEETLLFYVDTRADLDEFFIRKRQDYMNGDGWPTYLILSIRELKTTPIEAILDRCEKAKVYAQPHWEQHWENIRSWIVKE